MDISSMTGFSREDGSLVLDNKSYSWVWEIKSVNGKSLEIKVKLPSWLESLSQTIKSSVATYVTRGNVYVSLEIKTENDEPDLKINENLLNLLSLQAQKIYQSNPDMWQKPNPADILNIRGVVDAQERSLTEEEEALLQQELLKSLEKSAQKLQQDRLQEGAKMFAALQDIVDKISPIVVHIEEIAGDMPKRLKEKLNQQIKQMLEPSEQISDDRLAQEVLLLVNKADIREEIDRLKAHLRTARELFAGGGCVGRRLDFLCQELNRETNTICSKSADIILTNFGLELKALIEQFREQVQNIE